MNKNVFGKHKTGIINSNENNIFSHWKINKRTIIFITALLLYAVYFCTTNEKSRILYCDKVQDYCEIRIKSYLGLNKKIPICAPSTITFVKTERNFKLELYQRIKNLCTRPRNKDKYYICNYTLYAVNSSGTKTELYTKGQYERKRHEYQVNGNKQSEIRALMEKHADKINKMLQDGSAIIEYQIK